MTGVWLSNVCIWTNDLCQPSVQTKYQQVSWVANTTRENSWLALYSRMSLLSNSGHVLSSNKTWVTLLCNSIRDSCLTSIIRQVTCLKHAQIGILRILAFLDLDINIWELASSTRLKPEPVVWVWFFFNLKLRLRRWDMMHLVCS